MKFDKVLAVLGEDVRGLKNLKIPTEGRGPNSGVEEISTLRGGWGHAAVWVSRTNAGGNELEKTWSTRSDRPDKKVAAARNCHPVPWERKKKGGGYKRVPSKRVEEIERKERSYLGSVARAPHPYASRGDQTDSRG